MRRAVADDLEERVRFVRDHTAIASTSLVPEIELYLATEITTLWHASESWLKARGVPPPFWAFAWAGGQALARYVLDHPEVIAGKRVLDFASGSGIVGIAAALGRAKHVVSSDIDPFAEVVIRMNATLNRVAVMVERDDAVGHTLDNYDVVLAGDVCYERPMATVVTPWLRDRARAGQTVLLGDPGRAYLLPRDGREELARYEVPVSSDVEGRDVRTGAVFRVLP
ncbi:MAG: 50S ribosomal protein L11 methyltransferase [Polyangiales bacterium]